MVNTITMLAEQIQELDNMRLGKTGRACEQNSLIRAKKQELDRTEEEQAALKASQRLFEIYCETILQAEAFQADPEAYVEEMSDEMGEVFTIDVVLDMADDDLEYAEQVLVLARRLWQVSVCGIKMV